MPRTSSKTTTGRKKTAPRPKHVKVTAGQELHIHVLSPRGKEIGVHVTSADKKGRVQAPAPPVVEPSPISEET